MGVYDRDDLDLDLDLDWPLIKRRPREYERDRLEVYMGEREIDFFRPFEIERLLRALREIERRPREIERRPRRTLLRREIDRLRLDGERLRAEKPVK